jgi:hypothetical protein
MRATPARGGFTLTEMVIGSTILFLLAAALTGATKGLRDLGSAGGVQVDLQEMGERALAQITQDLKRSGFVTQGGVDYPHLFDDGAATGWFAPHAHAPAASEAEAGDADFGPSREIVLLAPQDADADGVPDLDGNGQLVWDAAELDYVLVTRPDGVNELQRRDTTGALRPVANHVERVVFDDNPTSGFEVPLGAVRVRIFFRKRDASGHLYRHTAEAVVRLRNG